MKKVFIDTNVLIDFMLEREGARNAADILQLGEEKKIRTAASFLTMANIAYIIRKGRTRTELYALLTDLSDVIEILPMDERQFKDALMQPASDFEDVLQYECAKTYGCDVIVTRNSKHFPFAQIPVLSPAEFLDQML